MTEDTDSGKRRSGILQPEDKRWIEGERPGHDPKFGLKTAVANSMEDIGFLFDQDLESISDPGLESLSELFDHLESDTGISREECAEHLIALAFIITNEPIDYEQVAEEIVLHPRDDSEMPKDEHREKKGGPVDFDQPVDEILSFRRALVRGLRLGKSRVERNRAGRQNEFPNEILPDTILVDSNMRLYKEPTIDRLDPKGRAQGFDTEQWRDALAHALDSSGPPEYDRSEISRSEAVQYMRYEIEANISHKLTTRRNLSNNEIRRHQIPR